MNLYAPTSSARSNRYAPVAPGDKASVRRAPGGWTVAVAAALLLAGCGADDRAATAVNPALAAGRLVVAPRMIADIKPVPATLTTRRLAEARARISGVLVALSVKEGDLVREGQLIARVRDDRIGLQTSAFDAQVAAAAAEAERARLELSRTRTLFSRGYYAKARLDQAEAQAKAADAGLDAARAQRGASAELAAQGSILAPAAGRVLKAETPVGSVVMAGQSVAVITAGPVVVRVELPEGQAAALRLGDVVQLNAEDLRGAASAGQVVQVYPAVAGGQVTADVAAPGLPLDLIGRRVRAGVKVGERAALVVPRSYLSTRFGVDFVRLAGPGGSTSDMPVQTTAGPTPDSVEILSGLRAGDALASVGPVR